MFTNSHNPGQSNWATTLTEMLSYYYEGLAKHIEPRYYLKLFTKRITDGVTETTGCPMQNLTMKWPT